MGHLKNKTRVLVTHQLQYLTKADHIIVLEEGEIIEQGTYHELSTKEKGFLAELLNKYTSKEEEEVEVKEEEKKKDEKDEKEKVKEEKEDKKKEKKKEENAKLIKEEERARGINIIFKI